MTYYVYIWSYEINDIATIRVTSDKTEAFHKMLEYASLDIDLSVSEIENKLTKTNKISNHNDYVDYSITNNSIAIDNKNGNPMFRAIIKEFPSDVPFNRYLIELDRNNNWNIKSFDGKTDIFNEMVKIISEKTNISNIEINDAVFGNNEYFKDSIDGMTIYCDIHKSYIKYIDGRNYTAVVY